MVSVVVAAALIALPIYWAFSTYTGLQRNLKLAKQSGLPYAIVPVWLYNPFWMTTALFWVPFIPKILPESWYKSWYRFITVDWCWTALYEPFRELGDTFITVSPQRNILWVTTAEAVHQIASRREAFPKPLESYKVLDLFGRNILTTEGADWKMHRKATSPGFNEKNNALVFKESIAQAQGMISYWMGDNDKTSATLKHIPEDTMRVTLHIISAMGFGVRLLWPGDKLKDGGDQDGLIYLGDEPSEGHTMSFQNAVATVLENIFVILLTPKVLLKWAPVKKAKEAWNAYVNWKQYLEELLEKKVAANLAGEHTEGMDIMGSLVKNATDEFRLKQKKSPGQMESSEVRKGLSDENILGNSFVMLVAGHETTANIIHFSLMELAINPSSQRHIQKDIHAAFGDSQPETWNYDASVNILLGNMVGATINEMLRLMPPVINIPKSVRPDQDQTTVIDGEKKIIPRGIHINLNAVGIHRSPKYWPSKGPSKISGRPDDLDDFVPERWLRQDGGHEVEDETEEEDFGGFTGKDTSSQLFRPPRGAFLPFSDGPRSCLGRRLAQVELIVVLSVIFQKYSVELAVDAWASDEEVERMGVEEKRAVYGKAQEKARAVLLTASSMLTLRLTRGETFIPVRVVKKGEERFIQYID